MQTSEDYKMPIMLVPGAPNYEHNIRVLAAQNPKHPRVVEYRQLMMVDGLEMDDGQGFDLLDDDEQWAAMMVKLAGEDEEQTKLTDDEVIRQFCDGTGEFAS